MKMDVKKIGAIVAGAAILASSVAFAGLYYEGVELVNDNGEPQVTIVVGENAAAKDGVAAAMIAAAIANKAYKDVELTAEVVGEATCKAAEGNGTTADCEVKDKTVTLEVTLPGLGDSAVEWGLLIAETGDKALGNRDADYYDYMQKLYEDRANPYTDQEGDTVLSGPNELQAMKVDGANFAPFKEATVTSTMYSLAASEKERVYVTGKTKYAKHEVYFNLRDVLYQAVFGPNDNGLNLCPGSDTLVDYTGNECSTDESLGSAKATIHFLGEPWVITDVYVPAISDSFDSEDQIKIINNAELKLAKESRSGVLNIGDCLSFDDGTQVCLGDVGREEGEDNQHPAIINVFASGKDPANDEPDIKDKIFPGSTKTIRLNGKEYKVHVYKTAAGYTMGEKWADMALISDEITLKSGKPFLDATDMESDDYKVYLGFTNKLKGSDASAVTHLKAIYLTATPGEDLEEGDRYYLTDSENFRNFEVIYNGLEDKEMHKLEVNIETSYSKTFKLKASDEDEDTVDLTNGKVVIFDFGNDGDAEVPSGAYVYTNGTAVGGSATVEKVYWILDGTIQNSTPVYLSVGDAVVELDNGDQYILDLTEDNVSGKNYIKYYWAGDKAGAVFFEANWTDNSTRDGKLDEYAEFVITEDIGEIGGSKGIAGYYFGVYAAGAGDDKIYAIYGDNTATPSASTDKDDISFYYEVGTLNSTIDTLAAVMTGSSPLFDGEDNSLTNYGYEDRDKYTQPFITPRGTEIDKDGTSVVFNVPEDLRRAMVMFKPTALAADKVNSQIIGPLREGDTATVGDVKIKVKEIKCEATATVSGGEGAYVADMTNVKAVIKAGDETYESYMAQKVTDIDATKLVTVDTLAADAGTIITVGGPAVNTMTQAAGVTVDELAENKVIVRVVGNKIVVAGYEADDTLEAAKQFIAALTAEAA